MTVVTKQAITSALEAEREKIVISPEAIETFKKTMRPLADFAVIQEGAEEPPTEEEKAVDPDLCDGVVHAAMVGAVTFGVQLGILLADDALEKIASEPSDDAGEEAWDITVTPEMIKEARYRLDDGKLAEGVVKFTEESEEHLAKRFAIAEQVLRAGGFESPATMAASAYRLGVADGVTFAGR